MELVCLECGHRWESDRESIDDFDDGPRCSRCNSRDVTERPVEGNGQPTEAAIAFDALADGAQPADLVRKHGIDPADARQYLEDWERLSDTHVVTSDELAEMRTGIREEVEAEASERIDRERRKASQRVEEAEGEIARLQRRVAELEREVGEEWQAAVRETTEVVEAECEDRIEEARAEEREEVAAEARKRLDELRETAGATIGDLQAELDRERRANERLSSLLGALKKGDEARIYAAGHRAGVLDAEATEAAKTEGALDLAKALSAGSP